MTTTLAQKQCVPCKEGGEPLKGPALEALHRQVPDWAVIQQHHLRRIFKFPDFKTALEFVDRVGELAEQENHHPSLFLAWGEVIVEVFTHKIGGLHENDFILAAKIDELSESGAD